MSRLSDEEQEAIAKRISTMSHEEMARLWRFTLAGDPVNGPIFDSRNNGLFEMFKKRFQSLGGWTPELSKRMERFVSDHD